VVMRWNERASYRTPYTYICLPLWFYDIANLSIRDLKHRDSVYYRILQIDWRRCCKLKMSWWCMMDQLIQNFYCCHKIPTFVPVITHKSQNTSSYSILLEMVVLYLHIRRERSVN
jgi:hypothetical protein